MKKTKKLKAPLNDEKQAKPKKNWFAIVVLLLMASGTGIGIALSSEKPAIPCQGDGYSNFIVKAQKETPGYRIDYSEAKFVLEPPNSDDIELEHCVDAVSDKDLVLIKFKTDIYMNESSRIHVYIPKIHYE